MTGVQEDVEDSWTVVTRKNKNKNAVFQVNKAASSKKDPVFEATSKLNEKKGRTEGQSTSLCCFDQVLQGTKVHLFQVPSSSVVDVFPGANDSAEMFKLQNPLFQQALKEDPHFATQVKSLELMLRVHDRVASEFAGETDIVDAALLLERLILRMRSWFALWPLVFLDPLIVNSSLKFVSLSGPSVRLHAHATASESTGIIGSLVWVISSKFR